MIYYAKILAKSDVKAVYEQFIAHGAKEESIIFDTSSAQKREGGIFQNLKSQLCRNDESLVIDSLQSLGKTNREISNELQWFVANNISIVVLDIPSTSCCSVAPITVLSEVYLKLAAIEKQNVKENQALGIQAAREAKKPLGRSKIPYPSNWEEVYRLWERKEITITEFMELTGLKRGTLYNLLKQYKTIESDFIQKEA